MAHIRWTPSLSVGIHVIDQQHAEYIRRVDAFLSACIAGQGRDEIAEVANFLASYVHEHFSFEEQLMRQHAYPELAAHLTLHDAFRSELSALRTQLDLTGPKTGVVLRANKLLVDWFLHHIVTADQAFGLFVQHAPAATAAR